MRFSYEHNALSRNVIVSIIWYAASLGFMYNLFPCGTECLERNLECVGIF